MKNLILLVALTFGVCFATKAQTKPGEFKFDTETFDFGKVAFEKPATHIFTFTNVGEAPIIITKVETTCGCTVPEYTQTPVKPGEKGTVKVTYNPAGSPMPFSKSVTLTSNARTTTKVLIVKGETVSGASK